MFVSSRILNRVTVACPTDLHRLIKVSFLGVFNSKCFSGSHTICHTHKDSSSDSSVGIKDVRNDSNDLPPTPCIENLRNDTEQFLQRVRDPKTLDTKYIPLKSKKTRGDGFTSKHFKDHVVAQVKGGNGGDGNISLLSVYRNEFAGPDGGDGGNGSHIIFKATGHKSSLCHVNHTLRGANGGVGRNKQRHGADALHSITQVPLGTVVCHEGVPVASLDIEHAMFVAARGGAGGKGNMFFASDTNQTPEVAEHGGMGEEFTYELELRTMADIGLIGFPNAGKSTLLRAVSRARPKVASYPFTTLNPHVGVVHYSDMMQLAVADIPGLIEDAHRNKGLGHAFLRHVQRCSGLLYVLDASQDRPWTQLEVLRHELEMYEEGLSTRPHAVVANKIDLPEAQANLEELRERVDLPVVGISAKHGQQVQELLSLLRWLTERNTRQHTLYQREKMGSWEDQH